MKARIDAILHRRQAEYLDRLLPERDGLLERIEKYADEFGHPIADPEVAQAMRILVRLRKPRRILEIGTNIGYSVIVMGREASPEAVIETIEIDPAILRTAKDFVAEAELPCRVVFHKGAALEVLAQLDGPFDLVFIDCVKTEYPLYLEKVLPKLGPEALIVCDNLLWGGRVAEAKPDEDASTKAIRAFNQIFVSHPRLVATVLPVGDGLGVALYS
jgi:caffeoyl-CoA O-methyltransferase